MDDARLLRARDAVGLVFVLNGLLFASWVSRIPEARRSLELDDGRLGLLLLAVAGGAMLALPASGRLIDRFGADRVLRTGGAVAGVGLAAVALGLLTGSVPLAATGLAAYGAGSGAWDVAMNVEGAVVERRLGRTVMPRFHAGFSIGTVVGALLGVALVGLGVPSLVHLLLVAAVGAVLTVRAAGRLPAADAAAADAHPSTAPGTPAAPARARSAWTEPRTLLIGVLVLALGTTEGTANDWLAVALVDGHGAAEWVGVAGYALFVSAMTTGRLLGPRVLDRHGRVPVLVGTVVLALGGVLLVVLPSTPALVVVGVVVWGLGASLGFPVGLSAAADDPARAARRVGVVSTIGYTAFLAGPPLVGFVADRTSSLDALLVVAAVLVPALLVVPVAGRPPRTAGHAAGTAPADSARPAR